MGEGSHGAFTLLEVILALSLSSLVMVAIGVAIDVQLRLLDTGRMQVEEAQLARALLSRMADDLRSTVLYDPMDIEALLTGVVAMPSEEELAALLEGGDLEAEEEEPDMDMATRTSSIPGLFGNDHMLQIDISRLPRLDEYEGLLDAGNEMLDDQACDVKTVTYYVVQNDPSMAAYATDEFEVRSGLVRIERNRATLAWEVGQDVGLDDRLSYGVDLEAEPIAPEVVGIQFAYFDGQEWFEEWDSILLGGLPVAIEITMAILPADTKADEMVVPTTAADFMATGQSPFLIFRQLVHLPMAQPASEGDMLEEAENLFEDSTSDTSDGVTRAGSGGISSGGSTGGMSAPSGGGGGGGMPSGPGGGR